MCSDLFLDDLLLLFDLKLINPIRVKVSVYKNEVA